MNTTRGFFLISAHEESINKILDSYSGDRQFRWVFLGRDVRKKYHLKSVIGDKGIPIDISENLQRTASMFRQEYIDYIGELGEKNHDRFWFLTTLSEKNPYISNLFLHFCSIKLCEELIRKYPVELVIICESEGLLRDLSVHFRDQTPIVVSDFSSVKNRIKKMHSLCFSPGISRGKFIFRYISRLIVARVFHFRRMKTRQKITSPERINNPRITIFSWLDSRFFKNAARSHDTYLGDLPSRIQKENADLEYIVDVLPTCWYPMAIARLARCNGSYFVLEDFLSLPDIFSSLIEVKRHRNNQAVFPQFCNVCLDNCIQEEYQEAEQTSRAEQSLLFWYAARRIGSTYPPDLLIYPFENHMWEKMLLFGMRESSPKSRLIGYAHSIVNRFYTCYSLSSWERTASPLPDQILVNGENAKTILANSGFPKTRILVAGALRFPKFTRVPQRQIPPEFAIVLIIMPIGINQSLELWYKILEVFRDYPEHRIVVKCHPTTPYKLVKKYLPSLPQHFQVSEKTIDELLPCAGVVLHNGSAASLEALHLQIPVVFVKSECTIDMDILEASGVSASLGDPVSIREWVNGAMVKNPNTPEHVADVFRGFFLPPNDDIIRTLISKNDKVIVYGSNSKNKY